MLWTIIFLLGFLNVCVKNIRTFYYTVYSFIKNCYKSQSHVDSVFEVRLNVSTAKITKELK